MKGNFNSHSPAEPVDTGVAILNLGRQYEKIKEEMLTALEKVCDSGQFVLGPEVKLLEQGIAAYSQVDHAVGCASGSDALLLALMALDIGPGDEVICPSFTFFATASAVTRLGATPVFADIEPSSFNISIEDVRKKITPRTKAIIPVHLYGQMVDMPELLNLTQNTEIKIIEDAAQSIGAEFDGRRCGSWGDMTALSFYPTKNLGGAGDGGMVTTREPALAAKLRLLRGHGMEPRYYHSLVGINSRLDSLQATILNVKLKYLDGWTMMRAQNANRYSEMFLEAGIDEYITRPVILPKRRHVWNQYVIRVPSEMRDSLRAELASKKIGSEIYYPLGLHEQVCFKYLGYSPESLVETYKASREVLALPMYPELRESEQRLVVNGIKNFFEENRQRHLFPGVETKRDAA